MANSTLKDIISLRLVDVSRELLQINDTIRKYNGFGAGEKQAIIGKVSEARTILLHVSNYVEGEYPQEEIKFEEEIKNEG